MPPPGTRMIGAIGKDAVHDGKELADPRFEGGKWGQVIFRLPDFSIGD